MTAVGTSWPDATAVPAVGSYTKLPRSQMLSFSATANSTQF